MINVFFLNRVQLSFALYKP